MSKLALAIATACGAGFVPKGPGTAGAIFAALAWLAGAPALASALIAFLPGVWSAGRVAIDRQLKDPQIVVIDEVIGQWITLIGAARVDLPHMLAGLALFRLFDIWKPWPVRALERLPGGWGIVIDDVMAGLYGYAVMRAPQWLGIEWFN